MNIITKTPPWDNREMIELQMLSRITIQLIELLVMVIDLLYDMDD
jgi:hypothetical protein